MFDLISTYLAARRTFAAADELQQREADGRSTRGAAWTLHNEFRLLAETLGYRIEKVEQPNVIRPNFRRPEGDGPRAA